MHRALLALWLTACAADPLAAERVPSRWIPAASRVEWTGPAGRATLSVDGGLLDAWEVVAEADVAAGAASLPLTLIPPGSWRWRLEVDDGRRRWSSGSEAFDVPDPPIVVLPLDADDGSEMSEGYWVGHRFAVRWEPDDGVPFVLDGDGEVVWWAPPDPDGGLAMRVKPSDDRRAILVLEDFEDGSRRALHRYALDGSERVETPMPDATHDFWENADGTLTWLAYTSSDTEPVPGQALPAVADRLRTVPEGALTGVEEGFDFFADFPRDPWRPCVHADFDQFVPQASEWTHTSSLLRSPRDDAWLLQVRNLDAVVAVEGHARLWQAGGRHATLAEPRPLFGHAHASHAWLADDGRIHLLVFDNQNHAPIPVSRAVELVIDLDAGTVDAVWELPDPAGVFTSFLGDARRLPGGNTVIAYPRGLLAEYTPDGEEVRRLEIQGLLGRGTWVPELAP